PLHRRIRRREEGQGAGGRSGRPAPALDAGWRAGRGPRAAAAAGGDAAEAPRPRVGVTSQVLEEAPVHRHQRRVDVPLRHLARAIALARGGGAVDADSDALRGLDAADADLAVIGIVMTESPAARLSRR